MRTFYPTEYKNIIDELEICGCGCPHEVYKAIYDTMSIINKRYNCVENTKDIEDEYREFMYDPYKQYMIYSLNHLGFLTHGSSIYGSMPTKKGYSLLDALEKFSKYDFDKSDPEFLVSEDFWEIKED